MQPSPEPGSSGAAEQIPGGVPEWPTAEQPAAAPLFQNHHLLLLSEPGLGELW